MPARTGRAKSKRHYPATPKRLTRSVPGPKAKKIIAHDHNSLSPSFTRPYPFVMERGQGSLVWDVDGNRFLDFSAGIAVNVTGHAHPTVVKAIRQQAGKFLHMSGTDFYYPSQVQLAERLTKIAPGDGAKRVFFTNSGTESIEAAMKLARHHTGRSQFIAFYGAFHGRTLGALSLTASKAVYRAGFSPHMPDVTHVPFAYCYRCPFNLKFPSCNIACVDHIEDTIFRHKVPPSEVAAIVVEPIQGEGGYIVPPDGWLAKLAALAKKHGIALIADEVQTGMGRTGKWFASEHWGVEPDIIALAKGIASGMPLGAVIAKKEVMDWGPGAQGSTFGGNPVSCAAALATLDLIEHGLMKNARVTGKQLLDRLSAMAMSHPCIGDVRGKGLMVGVELVKDKWSKAPATDLAKRVIQRAFEKGLLLLGCGQSTVRFMPALNVDSDAVETALSIFEEALTECERTM